MCKPTSGGQLQRQVFASAEAGIDSNNDVQRHLRFAIEDGNGSPSAQTAPSSKCSFFQIGTVRFKVSISQRQASKAAARCADATTMTTLASPISNRPRR